MSITIPFSGQNFQLPSQAERNWATQMNTYLQALGANALPRAGGSFTLSANLDLGSIATISMKALASKTANISVTGFLRLANTEGIGWRNAANNADLLLTVDASNRLTYNGVILSSSTGDLNGISTNGLVARTAANTYAARSIAGTTNRITVSQADGQAGNPTLDIGSDVVTLAGVQALTLKDFDGGTASNTSRMTVPKAATATLSALNRKQATLLYDTTLLKLLVDDGTNLQQVGTSSSGINLNPSPNDAGSWIASGAGVTVATTTTTAELPLAGVIASAIKITAVSGTDYARVRWTMPTSLFNTVIPVSWYQLVESGFASGDFKIDVYTNAASNYGGAYTRKALRSDSSSVTSIPASSGYFGAGNVCSFDSGTDLYYELRITRVAGTKYLTLANVKVGPGDTGVASAISDVSLTTTVIGATNGLAYTNTTVTNCAGLKVGSWLEVTGKLSFTGLPGTGTGPLAVRISTSGLTIDPARAQNWSQSGVFYDASAGAIYNLSPVPATTGSNIDIQFPISGDTAAAVYLIPASAPVAFASGDLLTFSVRIPIAEWAGSNPMVVGSAGTPQYYYSTGNTWGATNLSATTSQGQGGVLGGTTTPAGTGFAYSFTPTYPIPVGLKPELEFSPDGINWAGSGQDGGGNIIENLRFDGTNYIGAGVSLLSTGKIKVTFGKYSCGASSAWSGVWYWRVTVAYPGIPGLPYGQTDGSAQLYKAGSNAGLTTGAAIAAGMVGEVVEVTIGPTAATTSNVAFNIGGGVGMAVPAGKWRVDAHFYFAPGTVTSNTLVICALNTASATFPAVPYYTTFSTSAGTIGTGSPVMPLDLNLSAPQNVYFVAQYNFAAVGTSTVTAVIRRTRIA